MSVERCVELIKKAQCVACLTGAGISTNAGIPDFRGPNGLYVTRRYDPDQIFDIDYFRNDPKPFYAFAKDFIALEKNIEPTATHKFLAKLERSGKLKGIVTQNIDALHQRAGSQNVLEMHGSFWQSYCLYCAKQYTFVELAEILLNNEIAYCSCGGVIKPDIVFFGENVKYMQEAAELAENADLFFVIGTSCVVQPAASIPQLTQGKIIVVNMTEVNIGTGHVVLTVKEDMDQFFDNVSAQI